MEILVKYKLLNFGNGLIKPPEIYDGGKIWNSGTSLKDTEFIGKIDYVSGKTLPDGVIEIIKVEDVVQRESILKEQKIKQLKQNKYKTECDPLFFQALREKELGDLTKWNVYINKCEQIKNMTLGDF